MKRQLILLCIVSSYLLVSCTREIVAPVGQKLSFTASWPDIEETRTAIQSDAISVWWTTDEQINIFRGNSSGKFTSDNTEPASVVTFEGTLDIAAETGSYWAVYPYNTSNAFDGQCVTLTVPSVQPSVAGTFADKLFPAVAKSEDLTLSFYNVCGGARFSVSQTGINAVSFTAGDGCALAGTVKVSFGQDGKPMITEVLEGSNAITVDAPAGGFIPGQYYYAALLPQVLDGGLTITFKKTTGEAASIVIDKSITINRSRFGRLDDLDEGQEFIMVGHDPDDIIVFADERIKAHCVAAYDTSGDGEISYAEAAAATSVDGVFTSKLYTSFEEFRYFTGITEIPAEWFNGRVRLKAISLPESIVTVGKDAFADCNNITRIALGGKLLSSTTIKDLFPNAYTAISDIELINTAGEYTIAEKAFSDCTSLTDLFLSQGLTRIESDAFTSCTSLTKVTIPDMETWLKISYGSSSCHPFSSSKEGHLFISGKEITSFVVPQGITNIGRYAFSYCTSITEIILPQGLTNIGYDAFLGCTSLTKVTIPNMETWLHISYGSSSSHPFSSSKEGHLFISGKEITDFVVPQGLTSIGDYAFYFCTSLTEISLPQGLTSIGYYAFYNCTSLTEVSLPQRLISIGDSAFWNCTSLTEISLPQGLTSIGDSAFWNCTSLTEISLPQGLTSIGYGVFCNCTNLTEVSLPQGLTSIEVRAFSNCTSLTEISLPQGLSSIGNYAFSSCTSLTEISLPQGLSSIGNYAFSSCTSLTEISLPQGLISIGDSAFWNCQSLTEISLPQESISIGDGAFWKCKSLTRVNIPNYQSWMYYSYQTLSSMPFNDSKEGHIYISGKEVKQFIVPEDITSINSYAFYCCSGLEAIEMEPTVPPAISIGAFTHINCYIYVWEECYDAYVSEWPLYKYALRVYDQSTQVSEPDAIDLGLSVRWASCNLGASSPEECGNYYAWGETYPKDIPYSQETYKWWYGNQMQKYNSDDNKRTLDPEDDAAHFLLGGDWRMPSKEEWQELINNCNWQTEKENGVRGFRVKGKNGNSIFLPLISGDWACYWSSTGGNSIAWEIVAGFYSDINLHTNKRWNGEPIRPVTE